MIEISVYAAAQVLAELRMYCCVALELTLLLQLCGFIYPRKYEWKLIYGRIIWAVF